MDRFRIGVGATFASTSYTDAAGTERKGPAALVTIMETGAGPSAERQATVGEGSELRLGDRRFVVVRVVAADQGSVEIQEIRD